MDVVEVLRAAEDRQSVLSRQELRAAGVSDAGLARALACGRVVRVRRRVSALEPLPALPHLLVTDRGLDPQQALAVQHGGGPPGRGGAGPQLQQRRADRRHHGHSARVLATVRAALESGCSAVHLVRAAA